MSLNAVVIGASGGIGQALAKQLAESEHYKLVHLVSTQKLQPLNNRCITHQCDSTDGNSVKQLVEKLDGYGEVGLLVCCIGLLHESSSHLFPEKRLEDIDSENLQRYFQINTIAPAHWLQHAMPLVKHQHPAAMVFLSARVGSISDNRLGGWYGYRASKAALNMMIKTAQVEYSRRAKQVKLVCYHPGTVDTPLSEPFQANVKAEKLFTPEFTAKQLLSLLGDLPLESAPHFIDWQGQPIPW